MESKHIWNHLSMERKAPAGVMTDQFIQKYDKYMNFEILSTHYKFSEDMLRMYQHRVYWPYVLKINTFTESFLREMHINFDDDCWYVISKYQKLSERFMHEFAEKLASHWNVLVKYQAMSEQFIDLQNRRTKSFDCDPTEFCYNSDKSE